MLEVVFRRDSRQRLSSVSADGHAEAGAAGDDIVCAAASAILQAAQLGLEHYAQLSDSTQRSDGSMCVMIPADARDREDIRAIVTTAELAIAQLAWQFPVNVRITREQERDGTPEELESLGGP